jgi:two-component system cell cycle response regulator
LRQRLERQVQLKLLMDPVDFWQIMCVDPPDICLIDIKLPSFSGFELCQAVRSDARFDQVPVVLITGYPDPAERLRARQMGASDYLIKAIDMDQLWLRLSPFLRIPYTVG